MLGRGFEGWYFKHQKGPMTLALIAGRAADGAFIQVLTGQEAHRLRYPRPACEKRGAGLQLAGNTFSKQGIGLSIRHPALELAGRLHYGPLTPIHGDIMGPFRALPMQCRHSVVSMNHALTGSLCLNGQTLDFTGGKGYIEGDAGRSFPRSYTWVQCNHFEEDCSIMASAAHIPFALTGFWGCIAVVWRKGVEYRLATYRGAKIKRRDERQLLLVQGDLSLKVDFLQPHAGLPLAAPSRGRMGRSIHEVPCAPARFELLQAGQVLFQAESPYASYEYVE
ncbi:MAG: stress response protein nst1 [Clostridiales bacterium]|nr:stress response protein nst1 [Clostridiales bacterium]